MKNAVWVKLIFTYLKLGQQKFVKKKKGENQTRPIVQFLKTNYVDKAFFLSLENIEFYHIYL